jgi:glycolate oxidase iron-sulfur subunit
MTHQTIISRLMTKDYANLLDQCVHCGLCLESCPTYRIFRTEMESPRGRIKLMRAAAGGLLDEHAMKTSFKDHVSLCLVCLACEPACPSGVQYGKLATITRRTLEEISTKNALEKIISWLGQKQFLPNIGRLKLLALVLWIYQISGLQWFFRRMKAFPKRLQAAENLLPRISLQYPKYGPYEALEKRQGKVAFFHGCIQEAFLPHINQATLDVLHRNGFEVCTPASQTCCGAAQLHSGQH